MMKRTFTLILAAMLLISFFSFASQHEGERSVPIQSDDEGESAEDMYAKRLRILFTVIDCTGDKLLWNTAQDAADVWMSLTPIVILLELDDQNCTSGQFGNSISEIYWGVEFLQQAPLTGDYLRSYNASTRDIVEEDQFLVINQAQDLLTTTPIVLYNGLVHLMGNAMGLASIHDLYPEDCGWSVMLSACMRSRNPPQNADLDTVENIYFDRPELEFQVANFDQNGNGLIDQEEFDRAIDLWVFGALQDAFFMELIVWWQSQDPIPLAQSLHPEIAAYKIFDTFGRLISERGCSEIARLNFGRLVESGSAHVGAYIMLIQDCQTGQISVKMIAKLP